MHHDQYSSSPDSEDAMSSKRTWNVRFLDGKPSDAKYALIILNQPFTKPLINRLWGATQWRCCADGGANRLYDTFQDDTERTK
jgi:thiamine pyrophosphokinase